MTAAPAMQAARQRAQRISRRADWTFALLSCWLIAGLYLDGWAHEHFGDDLGTFFTPWHGFLYVGFLVLTVFLAGHLFAERRTTRSWGTALRGPYGLSALGAAIFILGAFSDLAWHTLFGIEVNVEALYSPTHLLLATAAVLILSGSLRLNWTTSEGETESGWRRYGPSVIGLILLLSLLVFFTEFLHPFGHPWAAAGNRPTPTVLGVVHLTPMIGGYPQLMSADVAETVGVASVLLQAAMLSGFLLLALRRWGASLPVGGVALLVAVPAFLVGLEHDGWALFPAAVAGGVAVELLARWLTPQPPGARGTRLFGFLSMSTLFGLYFADLAATSGVWWSIHLWAGAIFMAGIAGALVTFSFAPPFAEAPLSRR